MFSMQEFWRLFQQDHRGPVYNKKKYIIANGNTNSMQPFVNAVRKFNAKLAPLAPVHQKSLNQVLKNVPMGTRIKYRKSIAYAQTELKLPSITNRVPRFVPQSVSPSTPPVRPSTPPVRRRTAPAPIRRWRIFRGQFSERIVYVGGGKPPLDCDWDVKFRVSVALNTGTRDQIVVSVPIHATSANSAPPDLEFPTGHKPAPFHSSTAARWKKTIESVWNGAVLHYDNGQNGTRKVQYDLPIKFNVSFVDDSAQAAATVYSIVGSYTNIGTQHALFWGIFDGSDRKSYGIAHEFGHLIGNPDEYERCTFKPFNRTSLTHTATETNCSHLMCDDYTAVPAARNYWLVGEQAARLLNFGLNRCTIKRSGSTDYLLSRGHPFRGFTA